MIENEIITCLIIASVTLITITVLILTCKVRDLEARIEFAIQLNCETERAVKRISDEVLKMILDIAKKQDEDEGRVEAAKQMGFLK